MKRRKMVFSKLDEDIEMLVSEAGHKALGIWAADCAERVLPLFEERKPGDVRPREAVEALRAWVCTDVFRMADVRGASLSAHAAARDVGEDDAARSAARAAGQAIATAHVPRHAIAAAIYAATAVYYSADPAHADTALMKERRWQYQRLSRLAEHSKKRRGVAAKKGL